MATDIRALIAKNQSRWDGMALDPVRAAGVHIRASVLCRPENKARFQAAEQGILAKGLRMTWWFVAICAEREAGGPPRCWDAQLAQGDPLTRCPITTRPGADRSSITRLTPLRITRGSAAATTP